MAVFEHPTHFFFTLETFIRRHGMDSTFSQGREYGAILVPRGMPHHFIIVASLDDGETFRWFFEDGADGAD